MLLLLIAGFAGEAYSQAVAKIGDTEYATLAAACSAAYDGETIPMLADVEVNSTINVSNRSWSFILDLNGKTITSDCGTNKTLLQIGSGGDVTITDNSIGHDGVITCVNQNNQLRPLVLQGTGKLTINAGKVISPENPSAGFCAVSVSEASSTLIVNGGTLSTTKACTSVLYGVIYNTGTTIINGGTIRNTAESTSTSARGVHNHRYASLIVNGGEIISSEYAIFNMAAKELFSISSAAIITGSINNVALDEYIIADGSDLNFNGQVTANTITYDRGSSNTFGTVCLPFVPDSKSTITYYTLKEATDNTLTLEQVNEFVANTPYVYYTEDGTYNVSKTSTTTLAANPVAGTATNGDGWSLKGVYKRTSVFTSTSDADYDASNETHVVEPNSYYIKDNGFSKTDGYVVIKPFRAYITAPDGAGSSNHFEISVIDEATSMKSLLDGEQMISAIYDINGIKLNKLQRGVNIVVLGNGKTGKIIVK